MDCSGTNPDLRLALWAKMALRWWPSSRWAAVALGPVRFEVEVEDVCCSLFGPLCRLLNLLSEAKRAKGPLKMLDHTKGRPNFVASPTLAFL
ncbi:hypothetical protein VNO78_19850 [Psophocarpus tetragonolobus]|uniref:Uncharacterized protein n=1 Tax=Psophocarpus tetragonolobus TaxID=3891 RepID=A0AAN9XGK6_PSOTE